MILVRSLTRVHQWAALAVILGLTVLREPLLFQFPRIWAEEGKFYLAQAYGKTLAEALAFVEFGYYNLSATAAGYFAGNFFPLEQAPGVTLSVALFVQMIAFYIILSSRAAFWDSPIKKLVGAALVLFIPNAPEVWLNSINSQYWLTLIAFLILLEDIPSLTRNRRWAFRVLLFFAGLSTPMACYLTPVFLWDAWTSRLNWKPAGRERSAQTLILAFCSLVELGSMIYVWKTQTQTMGSRFTGMSLATFFLILFDRTMFIPVFGPQPAEWIVAYVKSIERSQFHLFGAAIAVTAVGFLFALYRSIEPRWRFKLFASYLLVVFLNINTAIEDKNAMIGPEPAQRYFFVPMIMFMFIVLSAKNCTGQAWRAIFSLLLGLSIGSGIYEFRGSVRASADWPKWTSEISNWRNDPSYEIQIQPPPWAMSLKPKTDD